MSATGRPSGPSCATYSTDLIAQCDPLGIVGPLGVDQYMLAAGVQPSTSPSVFQISPSPQPRNEDDPVFIVSREVSDPSEEPEPSNLLPCSYQNVADTGKGPSEHPGILTYSPVFPRSVLTFPETENPWQEDVLHSRHHLSLHDMSITTSTETVSSQRSPEGYWDMSGSNTTRSISVSTVSVADDYSLPGEPARIHGSLDSHLPQASLPSTNANETVIGSTRPSLSHLVLPINLAFAVLWGVHQFIPIVTSRDLFAQAPKSIGIAIALVIFSIILTIVGIALKHRASTFQDTDAPRWPVSCFRRASVFRISRLLICFGLVALVGGWVALAWPFISAPLRIVVLVLFCITAIAVMFFLSSEAPLSDIPYTDIV